MAVDRGLGMLAAATLDLAGGPSAQMLKPLPLLKFELSEESETTELQAFVGGRLVTQESFEASSKVTLSVESEIANWDMIGTSIGESARTFTALEVPIIKEAVVPAGGVINDAEIVAGNSASVIAAITRFGPWGQAGPLLRSTAAPTTGQVQVAAGTLTFNTAQVGAPIAYLVVRTLTGRGYGGPGAPAKLGDLQFSGRVYDNTAQPERGGFLWIPRMQQSSQPTFAYDGSKVTLAIQYLCINPPGWQGKPYLRLDGQSIV